MVKSNLSGAFIGITAALVCNMNGSPVFAAPSAHHAKLFPMAATHSSVMKLVQSSDSRQAAPLVPPIPGMTSINVPLFPGAIRSTQPFPDATIQTPGSWYVRTAKAEYLLPAANGTVENWYDSQMAPLGFKSVGSARSGNVTSGVTSIGQFYAPVHQPHGHHIELDLSFRQSSDNKTLLIYWATDVVVPPRPSYTLIPKDVVSMDIHMTAYGTSVKNSTKHVDDPAAINRFRLAVNALTNLVPGINPGGPNSRGDATVLLHTKRGQTITMSVSDTLGISVNRAGITDYNGTVWRVLEDIMGVHVSPA